MSELEMKGTPITRGGGRFIRVGWRAAGYSVDEATKTKYRIWRVVLFLLAVAAGVAVVEGASYVFFTFALPLAVKVFPFLKNYPQIYMLLIYLSTLFFGGLVFWHIKARVGESLVKGQNPVHPGFSLLEQRQRACMRRKRERIPLLIAVGVLVFAPLGLTTSLQLFLVLIPLFFLLEGVFFQFREKE